MGRRSQRARGGRCVKRRQEGAARPGPKRLARCCRPALDPDRSGPVMPTWRASHLTTSTCSTALQHAYIYSHPPLFLLCPRALPPAPAPPCPARHALGAMRHDSRHVATPAGLEPRVPALAPESLGRPVPALVLEALHRRYWSATLLCAPASSLTAVQDRDGSFSTGSRFTLPPLRRAIPASTRETSPARSPTLDPSRSQRLAAWASLCWAPTTSITPSPSLTMSRSIPVSSLAGLTKALRS